MRRIALGATLIAIGAAVQAQSVAPSTFALEAAVPQTRRLAAGERHSYSVALSADVCARLELSPSLGVRVSVRGPGGASTVAVDDGSEEMPPQPITIVAASGGDYVVDLQMHEGAESSEYTIAARSIAPCRDRDRSEQRGEALFREGLRLFKQTARETRLSAVERYREAEAIFKSSGNRRMEAKAVDKIGQVYNRLGESKLAQQAYEEVLPIFRELADRGQEASTLNNIGLERINQGQFTDAIEPLKQAARIFHEIGDTWTERSPINNLGLAYYRLAEIDKSQEYYERALAIARANGDASGEAFAHAGIGALALLKGQLQPTLDAFTRAHELWSGVENHQMAALALGNLGTTHLYFGDAQAALDYLTREQELRNRAPNRNQEATTLGNLAAAHQLRGDLDTARDIAGTAVAKSRELGNPSREGSSHAILAGIQSMRGELDAARASYETAIRLAHEAGNRQVEAESTSRLSGVRLRQGALADAAALAANALAIAREANLRFPEEEALVALGRAESASHALEAAREHAAQAVALADSIRSSVAGPAQRSAYIGHSHDAYGLLVDVLMRLDRAQPSANYLKAAFEASERARARSLVDLLAESRVNIREGVEPALVAREASLRAALAARRTESDERLGSLLVEYRQLQNTIRARSPRYASLAEPEASTLATVQRDLDDRTLLVEYALGDERSYVWVVGSDSIAGRELPPRRELESLARRVYAAISQPRSPDASAALRALSDAVVAPVQDRLAGKRLAVVAEGALQYVPWTVLLDAGGRPLAEGHEIVSLPSASTLRALRQDAASRQPASRSVFVVADPVFDRLDSRVQGGETREAAAVPVRLERSARDAGVASLDRLWFTRREAESIAALAPERDATTLLDFDASLPQVLSSSLTSYRVVHFATHGLLNNKHPELSGLVFSLVDPRGRPHEGFLPVYEVYNLKLNADLVVLSACQTALGEDIRGEGLVGLTRAFMYAGALRVIASLWRVPDSATAALMQRFYRALLVDKRPAAEALRSAQQAVRADRRWAAPYYWAGFTLVGEWK